MGRFNLKSIIVSLIILIIGILLIVADIYWILSESRVWIGIGCSLIAASSVILLNVFLVDEKRFSPLDEWGIEKIYDNRAEKNKDFDPKLETLEYHLDIVAFGLKSFRGKNGDRIEKCLMNGVNIRLLTMNPESSFVEQREKEENEVAGQIKKSIEDLVEWANNLNRKKHKGKITVKGYTCMTLDFYWRADDDLFIGPYWHGIDSQQTVTYKFIKGKRGFDLYANYFEKLWENTEFFTLTQ